jgi:chromosome segregation and condensation protein ScpB
LEAEALKRLEAGLGSRGRIRILAHLAHQRQPLTRYRLRQLTGLNTADLKADLKVLISLGWVVEHPTRPVKYGLNQGSEEAREVERLLLRLTGP